ncbi:MAG: HAMP domain-containing histidine kinase [Bacteroidales bacterium]|nr:HAMP domain-containing histidine kinase [Bacteroidales bacterium]
MKRLLVITALFALALTLRAQNNPYQIDDDCYAALRKAEQLEGQPGFERANEALLQKALEEDDAKAQALYYVERLKNAVALLRDRESTTLKEDEEVLSYMEELKSVADGLGQSRYFYYAYDIAQQYFMFHGKLLQTMELVQDMREQAVARNEPYGIWMGNRYIISLYINQNDFISAKKYIQEAIRVYETTKDPVIREESAARLYCEMSDTYPIGNDSVPYFLAKADAARKLHMDTLRCEYHHAKLAAYQRDVKRYEYARDYCLADPLLPQISVTADKMFNYIDRLVYGQPIEEFDIVTMSRHLREVKYIANIAEEYGRKELAFKIEKNLVAYEEKVLASANQSKLTEIEAKMGNDVLHALVDEEAHRAQTAYRMVTVLLLLVLAVVMVFFLLYTRSLQKTNERVRLADAAKTRFVQNMSHEVRTPLNAIVGFSQLLSLPDGTFPEKEKEEFAGHIVNNTKMLTMLLDDILNASAMDVGNYSINYEEGEVNYMAEAAISSAEHRLQPGVKMYYAPEDDAPYTFRTDPRRVQQILINLLTNACKHTSSGEIRLSSSLKENPGFVTYSVTDTGTGVPADQAEKIFERFTKLNDFVQGTGLGLSICRDIASRMGAKVFLDTSYTQGGSRFVLSLPCTPTENQSDKI